MIFDIMVINMAKLKLDLHPIYNKGGSIEASLQKVIKDACEKKNNLC